MKKTVSVILLICSLLVFVCNSSAAESVGDISVRINSDIAGMTERDTEKLIEIEKENVVYSTEGDGPVSIYDYAGTHTSEAVSAGRTYNIYYTLVAADGYVLPDFLAEGDIDYLCGRGVNVISSQIVTAKVNTDGVGPENFRGILIFAHVRVDGNFFQRAAGFIYDRLLKFRAWSIY